MTSKNKLKVVAVPTENIFEVSFGDNGSIMLENGPDVKLLKTILQSLDSDYELLIPKETVWGSEDSRGNWTGMMGMLESNEADLAVNQIAVTEARSKVVEFSPVYSSSPVTFVTRIPALKDKSLVYTYPFESTVWICLVISILIFTCILHFVLKKAQPKKKHRFSSLMTYLFGFLVNQGYSKHFCNGSVRLLLGSWMIFGMMLTFSYMGVLLSLVIHPLKEPALSTVQDLVRAVNDGRFSCGVLEGTYYHDIFLVKILQNIFRLIYVLFVSQKEIIKKWK